MSRKEYEYLIDVPIMQGLANALGRDYCEGKDHIAETNTFINPNSGDRADRCDDCRPGGWVRQRETKD